MIYQTRISQDASNANQRPRMQCNGVLNVICPDRIDPIAKTIQGTFNAPIEKIWRGEDEYYRFNVQSQLGQPIQVSMRPNGDIIQVRNESAHQEEQALQAKAKQPAGKASNKKKG